MNTKNFPSLLWVQTTMLALPFGFLLAGGCGGGNGVTVPPPVVLGAPTPVGGIQPTLIPTVAATSVPGDTSTPIPIATSIATPVPVNTSVPTPTATPTALPTATPHSAPTEPYVDLNFADRTASGSPESLQIRMSADLRGFNIKVGGRDGSYAVGQTFNATAAFNQEVSLRQGGVTYSRRGASWNSVGGTITITAYVPGSVHPDSPGRLSFRLSNVQMVPTFGSDTTTGFVINGTYSATQGIVR